MKILFFNKKKSLNNVKETQKQAQQKLFRFTRGNKALTPEQQLELFRINEANLKAIQKHLTYMKGVYNEAKKFEK